MNRRHNLQTLLQTLLATSALPTLSSYAQSLPDVAEPAMGEAFVVKLGTVGSPDLARARTSFN